MAENKAKAKIVLPPVNQVGILLKDAAKVAEYYSSMFGIGQFTTYDTNLERATLYGQPAPTKLRLVIAQMGAIEIELIQVLEGGEFYHQFLRNKGEGLHHLGSYTDDLASYDRVLAELANQGIRPTFQYRGRSLRFTYLDTSAIGGLIFEVINLERRG